jgi:hypothetical protein
VSLLNVFFLATDEELAAVDIRMGPAHPGVDVNGVMDVELATLESILHGESLDDADAVVELIQDPVRQEPEADPEAWISPLSDRLVTALGSADEARLAGAAGPWVATEEMEGWTRDEAASLLAALGDLCRRGQAERRQVYRWFSL